MSVKTERSTFSHFLFPDLIGMGGCQPTSNRFFFTLLPQDKTQQGCLAFSPFLDRSHHAFSAEPSVHVTGGLGRDPLTE